MRLLVHSYVFIGASWQPRQLTFCSLLLEGQICSLTEFLCVISVPCSWQFILAVAVLCWMSASIILTQPTKPTSPYPGRAHLPFAVYIVCFIHAKIYSFGSTLENILFCLWLLKHSSSCPYCIILAMHSVDTAVHTDHEAVIHLESDGVHCYGL